MTGEEHEPLFCSDRTGGHAFNARGVCSHCSATVAEWVGAELALAERPGLVPEIEVELAADALSETALAGTVEERSAALVAHLGRENTRHVMTWLLGELARLRERTELALEAEGGTEHARTLDRAGDELALLVVNLNRAWSSSIDRAPSDGEDDE